MARKPDLEARILADQSPSVGIESDRKAAYRLLLQAHSDAQETGRSPEEFAVDLTELRVSGVSTSDLRWLLSKGYAEHLLDKTPVRGSTRQLVSFASLAFKANSCFTLTKKGLEQARQHLSLSMTVPSINWASNGSKVSPIQPNWKLATRELFVGGELVRRFLTKADNQVKILNAFQEESWPEHLDDPLPPNGSSEQKRRLHDAINKLNRHQIKPLIQFRGDGTGRGVCWRFITAIP